NFIYSPNTLGNAINPGININSETSEGGNTSATFDTGNVIVRNNVVVGMKRGIGQLAGAGGTFKFENFIIENNTLINSTEAGIHIAGNADLVNYVIRNNVIYQGPGSTGIVVNYNGGKDITWYNNAWSSTPNVSAQGANDVIITTADLVNPDDNIDDNNPDINNYAPASGSDLIDASGATTINTDYFTNTANGVRDIGAIEYNGISSPGTGYEGCLNNILSNGDFATNITGWNVSGTSISASYDAGTAKIIVSGNSGTQQFYQNNLNIVNGQDYILKFAVTGPNGVEIRTDIVDDLSAVTDLGMGIHNEILNGTEQTFTYTFTANANSSNGRLRFRFQNGIGTFNIYNICLIEATLSVDYDYSAPQSPIYVNDVINFTSLVTSTSDIDTYLWDFDNGDTATTEDTTYAFDTPGTYVVSLTVEDVDGNITSISKELIIQQIISDASELKIGKAFLTALIATS
ncbi:MAG: PKD domain-containing protein, partial [Candidatus Riesia sp.]|nr:PKD domain-containing protein [Candidatus Riesia sp.]